MRMPAKEYEYLKRAISHLDDCRNLLDRSKQYEREGLSPKRFRWDCTYGAGLSKWICDNIYSQGMDDAHIDTALRKVMRYLGLDWASQK